MNRLGSTSSPYLRQHANNPVDWFPWCDEAFEEARAEDRPVFLSIGYSTCHWCHVMAHESFENEQAASLLNEAFVCIKVDREERPDIDDLYMTTCQMLTGQGGWPLTILLTPDKHPFFAATYIPLTSRGGHIGLLQLIPAISHAWETKREDLLASAQHIIEHMGATRSIDPPLPDSIINDAYAALNNSFDPRNGGFGLAPKFPQPHTLRFLMQCHTNSSRGIIETTLQSIRCGGIWDHVGKGMHRYATDAFWHIPHFEKMLYDQAMMMQACLDAWEYDHLAFARQMALDLFDYVQRSLRSPDGRFYTAEDADSEGIEGLFYVWRDEELAEVLTHDERTWMKKHFHLPAQGNRRDEATGQLCGDHILYTAKPGYDTATFEPIRRKLFVRRELRIHPFRDTKRLTDWNSLMIAACAHGARILNNKALLDQAIDTATCILNQMVYADHRVWHCHRTEEQPVPGLLEDYAFFIQALLELYDTTLDFTWLDHAFALNDTVMNHFADRQHHGFFRTADDANELPARTKSFYDGAVPSGYAVQLHNLTALSRMGGNVDLEVFAQRSIDACASLIRHAPAQFTETLRALQILQSPGTEVVIVGKKDDPDTHSLIQTVRAAPPSHDLVLLLKEPVDDRFITRIPYAKDMHCIGGKPTAYLCRNHACEHPVTDTAELIRLLQINKPVR
ncbi:MAG: thioredoxin domain-containing protein [Spartobacteria bacterium]|nr:thioredoxin domain-containing protein [Spartobacteria bacterium]